MEGMKTTPNELSPDERAKIHHFLVSHPVGVLATVDPDGEPQASAIYFSVDNDLHIRFTTKEGTRKYANIANHPSVVLAVYDAADQALVQIEGRAVERTDHEEQKEAYEGTIHAAGQTGADVVPPIAKIPAGKYVAFEIEISNIHMAEYGWGDNFANAMHKADSEPTGGDPL